jgi:hypothetical protein
LKGPPNPIKGNADMENPLEPDIIRSEINNCLGLIVQMRCDGLIEKQRLIFSRDDDKLIIYFTNTLFLTEYSVSERTGVFTHPRIDRILIRARDRLHESRL